MAIRILLVALAMTLFARGAYAQETADCTKQITSWSVCDASNPPPRECWAVTIPEKTVNTKDGRVVAVRRSQILLMVAFRPGEEDQGQIAFTGGYPFKGGSSVSLTIDGTTFQLITDGEWAWPASGGDDAKIVAAMKRGSQAVAVAMSSRGTRTEDSFSLAGFTAAFDEAEKRCKA